MLPDDLIREGQHVLTVCNACRYCEAYCPVFPAIEDRQTFADADLSYLANLCHNCGECLYACQYAPPHEFGINVPRTLAQIRVASYETGSWPGALGVAFRRPAAATLVSMAGGLAVVAALAQAAGDRTAPPADFYAVVPHGIMVTLFSTLALLVVAVLAIPRKRGRVSFPEPVGIPDDRPETLVFSVKERGRVSFRLRGSAAGIRDALTLKYLHGAGADCTSAEESRTPWRRWFHHCTFYGFALCFASTSVAAVYHLVFGWRAPYPYTSLPVVLGTTGGIGLLVGPAGLAALARSKDPNLTDAAHQRLSTSFVAILFLTSLTGLMLMALRDRSWMPALLVVHLANVFGLFVMLPYGKFVHGIYRAAALIKFADERRGQA